MGTGGVSELTQLIGDLVRINSVNPSLDPTGPGEGEIAAFVADWMRDAGLDVPDVFASTEGAVLMEYVGDGSMAAPQLQHAELERHEAGPLWERLLRNIEETLRLDTVHGDLSPYNVLYWKGRPFIIDFPQTRHHSRRPCVHESASQSHDSFSAHLFAERRLTRAQHD